MRIEDTDRVRSTPEATAAILKGLTWLGLDWDGEVVRQSERGADHEAAIGSLTAQGLVYECYCTRREILAGAGLTALGVAAGLALAGFVAVVFNYTIVNTYFPGLHSYAGLPG